MFLLFHFPQPVSIPWLCPQVYTDRTMPIERGRKERKQVLSEWESVAVTKVAAVQKTRTYSSDPDIDVKGWALERDGVG